MSELDFRKQLLINEFKTLSKGKKNDEMLPLVLAICNKAKQSGITFTKKDCEILFDNIKQDMTEHQKMMISELMQMF